MSTLYGIAEIIDAIVVFVVALFILKFMHMISKYSFNYYNSLFNKVKNSTIIIIGTLTFYVMILVLIYGYYKYSFKFHIRNANLVELTLFVVAFFLFVIVEITLGKTFYKSFKCQNSQLNINLLHQNTLSFISTIVLEHIEVLAFILTAISFPNANEFNLGIIAIVIPLTFFMFRVKEQSHYKLLLKNDDYNKNINERKID